MTLFTDQGQGSRSYTPKTVFLYGRVICQIYRKFSGEFKYAMTIQHYGFFLGQKGQNVKKIII